MSNTYQNYPSLSPNIQRMTISGPVLYGELRFLSVSLSRLSLPFSLRQMPPCLQLELP